MIKRKTKKFLALSLVAMLCASIAVFATVINVAPVSASEPTKFTMAEGASIRLTSEEGKKEGLRFIVLADEATKNAIVDSGKFGVIISSAEDFKSVSSDYIKNLDTMKYETTKEITDSLVIADMFYQNAEEYGDDWCANIVINMSANSDFDNQENFTERKYSAVAYYSADGVNYEYTTNRQDRSVQEVASKIYLQGDESWGDVTETYENIGTETTPLLVAQKGDNSYNKLLDKADAGEGGYYFELAENIVAEKDLSKDVNFTGNFVDSEYTVSSPEGYILDGTSASDLNFLNNKDGISASVSFDSNEKYDTKSNGSYVIELDTAKNVDDSLIPVSGNKSFTFGINPAYRKAYYQSLSNNGYDYIAIRYKIAENTYSGTTRFDYAMAESSVCAMGIYYNGEMVVDKGVNSGNKSYTFWGSSNLKQAPLNSWAEMILDIDMFINSCTDEGVDLFHLIVIDGSAWDLTMYIDNIYAVNGEAVDETKYVDEEFNVSADGIMLSLAKNGETIENSNVLNDSGLYTLQAVKRNTYGVTENTYYVGTDIVAYDVASFYATNNKGSTGSAASDDFVIAKEENKIKITATENSKSSKAPNATGFRVKTLYDKAYFQSLLDRGYAYITYEFKLESTATYGNSTMCRWAFSKYQMTHYNNEANTYGVSCFGQWWKRGNNSIEQNDTTTPKSSHRTSYSDSYIINQDLIVSFSIEDYINNYTDNHYMWIAGLWFNNGTAFDYSVTFGRIEATTQPCVFDN